ncbi:MAG: dihydroorotase family protein [Thermofilum sp.]|nr:dihydroorotase family protein [Thermofilum sp.]
MSAAVRVDAVFVGRAYLGGRFEEVAVAVEGDTIAAVTKPALAPRGEETVVLGPKQLLLPGMVDLHVHMREPGLEHKEDWRSGSMSAAKGGVTCVFDMPNNVPPANTCDRLREKVAKALSKSIVDFGLYAGCSDEPETLKPCADLFFGFKLYPEDLYSPRARPTFKLAAELGKPVFVHAEDPSLFRDSPLHSEARPPEAEASAVELALELARSTGAWLHLTHVSTKPALERVLASKALGKVTFDVTPHHMLLSDSLYRSPLAKIAKVNPPLRSEEHRAAVYAAARSGAADALVTDHAPHALAEKLSENPPPGFPGLELALHLLLKEVLEGRLPPSAIDLYSSKPARLAGLRKGVVAPGFDADLVIVELAEWSVKGSELVSKAKYTPFEGWTMRTKTVATYVRGRCVYRDGEFSEGGARA